MGRKPVLVSTLIILVICTLSGCWRVQKARASGTIFIRADGRIDPSDAPISSIDNVTYVLTADIFESIFVEKDSITIDGAGYSILGLGSGCGVDVSGQHNVTIKHTSIKGFYLGISLDHNASGNTISRNIVKNNERGLQLYGYHNLISDNHIANNGYGIELQRSSSNNISGNNIAHNKYVAVNLQDSSTNMIAGNNITENEGNGISASGSNNTISDNKFANNTWSIDLYGSNHTISENIIINSVGGLHLVGSNDTVSTNTLSNNEYSIVLLDSVDHTLRNNSMAANRYNFGVTGSSLAHFTHDIAESNTVNGKPVHYWINRTNQEVPPDTGYLALVNSRNITVHDLELRSNYQGLLLAYTKNSTIANNQITHNLNGIELYGSSGNTITQNNVTENDNGIAFDGSYTNKLRENNVANNRGIGLQLHHSHSNSLHNNNVDENDGIGLQLSQCFNNNITANNITKNEKGIWLDRSSDNIFYHNHFIANQREHVLVYDSGENVWDNGFPSGGNYWSDYANKYPNAEERGGSGIWDTPYVIDGNNRDNYPIVPELPPWLILPIFMILTLLVAVSLNAHAREQERI